MDTGTRDWLIAQLGQHKVSLAVHDFECACAQLRHERNVTLELLADLPWQVIVSPQPDPPCAAAVQTVAGERLAETIELKKSSTTPAHRSLSGSTTCTPAGRS
ncbi:MAG: hypothetical protein ACRDRL_22055, partial [Sciscionella sp.]